MFSKINNNNKTDKLESKDPNLEDYLLENSVLKSKLQSKVAALAIMSKEMDKCSMERDRYRVLVEQIKTRKTCANGSISEDSYQVQSHSSMISGGELLAITREENHSLRIEVEILKSNLEEASEDIIALRKQLQVANSCRGKGVNATLTYTQQDHEDLVRQLEKNRKKYLQLQQDYKATLDEKEEIIQDRDYYKTKVQRLNQQISYIISNRESGGGGGDLPKPVVDLDALIAENKYLHERVTQLQVEKEILKRSLTKYKSLLENRDKLAKCNSRKGFIDVMTQNQVREYLENHSKAGSKRSSAPELKSLCLGLNEALNDKSIALQHQRKTNQILANRISELEKTLESWCEGRKCVPIFPSDLLIEDSVHDSNSIKSEDIKESDDKTRVNTDKLENMEFGDSVDMSSDSSSDENTQYKEVNDDVEGLSGKIVLPEDLQELVREALAQIKPCHNPT